MLFTKEAFDVLRNEGRAMKLIFPIIISMISNGISRRSIVDDDDNELRRMRAEGRVKDSRRRAAGEFVSIHLIHFSTVSKLCILGKPPTLRMMIADDAMNLFK